MWSLKSILITLSLFLFFASVEPTTVISTSSTSSHVSSSSSHSSSVSSSTKSLSTSSKSLSSSTLSTSSKSLSSSTSSKISSVTSSSSSSKSSSKSTSSSSSSKSSPKSSSSSIKPSSSSSSSSAIPSATGCSYWLENMNHVGRASFNSNPASYQVFRNVKSFGAKGDGVTDDTAAINAAISSGGRCGPGSCASSTTNPATVYFPAGTYLVSSPIIDYYYTTIIGNPNCVPVIKASSSFSARWVIDGDQYQPGGALGWGSTNIFWRQIRNFVIDMTSVSPSILVAGIHWPTAQATSLQNIVFKMSSARGTQHEGLFIESGSGGYLGDLTFFGGLHGASIGNQQFTMRNLVFNNAVIAINQLWDWGWTYTGITINNCGVGLDMSAGNTLSVGSVLMIDSSITNTPIGIRTGNSGPVVGNSLILENVLLSNVPVAVQGTGGTILQGTVNQVLIGAWGQGHNYNPGGPHTFQTSFNPVSRPSSLLSGSKYYSQSKPSYASFTSVSFLSVRAAGAKGDGVTDDTAALNAVLALAATSGKIVYFDHGNYRVTSTIFIPPSSKIVGEAYPVILASGSFFANINSPQPVVRVGNSGNSGVVQWSDMIVSTQGPCSGAILIEWNLGSTSASPSGMWDVHTRIGGFTGSKLQLSTCPKTPTSTNVNTNCIAAFISMHITKSSSGLYMENNWFWTADHDVDDPNLSQITIFAGRGLLIESVVGGIWLVGTAVEHHALYQYQLSSTTNIFMGQIQTETAYYQPNPSTNSPYASLSSWNDPIFPAGSSGWGVRVVASSNISVYGAGLYSFFSNYNVNCSNQGGSENCQTQIFSIEGSSGVRVYNLNTVGVEAMITLNGNNIASFSDNLNGFVDTIALFTTGSS